MKAVFAIDIGNTNINMGIFVESALAARGKIPSRAAAGVATKAIRTLLKRVSLRRKGERRLPVIISSVVPQSLRMVKRALRAFPGCRVLTLGENARVPIENLYRITAQVGQDRLVNSFAAAQLYGAPAVVIDFGTAVTFDCVSRRGEYLGGLIMPGIRISLEALYEKTALLPKAELLTVRHIIGKTTQESIRSGVLFGFGFACEGLIGKCRASFGRSLRVIATGGDAELMKRYAPSMRIIDPDLTLKGLMLVMGRLEREKSVEKGIARCKKVQ